MWCPAAFCTLLAPWQVSGAERCRWKERKQSGKVTHAETYIGKHIIVSLKQQLHGPGTLAPGSYQWPFSFALPLNVPGTFHYATNDGTRCVCTGVYVYNCHTRRKRPVHAH